MLHEPHPHVGHRKYQPTSKVTQWHEQSTIVTFRLFTGESIRPLTRSPEKLKSNHQHVPDLHRCSKTSRLRQRPRVTKNPHPQRSPSATRCNHSSKCTKNHSQSHFNDESRMKISVRCLFRLTRMSSISKYQEGELQAGTFLFIDPKDQRAVGQFGVIGRTDRTQGYQTHDRTHPCVRSVSVRSL
jgi:hypothetical protein